MIAKGTPEEVAECPNSYTGQYIKKYLEQERNREKMENFRNAEKA